MYNQAQKIADVNNAIKTLDSMIRKQEDVENVAKYSVEIIKARAIGGYESPEPGDIPEAGKELLAKVYASCRKDGGDKEYCSKVAWTAVKNAGYKSIDKMRIIKSIKANMEKLAELSVKKNQDMLPVEQSREEPTKTKFGSLGTQSFLMAFPYNLDNKNPNNPWMKGKELLPINYDLAYSQWIDLKDIVSMGNLVYVLPSQHDLQDEVYTANLGLMLPQNIRKDTIILSNFRSDPRDHEENVGRGFFSLMEFNIIQSPNWFEGEADLKHLKDNIFIGGYGIRSQVESFDWMEKEFGIKVIKAKMKDEKLYHFDTQCFPIDKENVMLVTEVCDEKDIAEIEQVANIIDVPYEYGLEGQTNCIRVGEKILNASSITEMHNTDEKYSVEIKRIQWFNDIMAKNGLTPAPAIA